MKTGKEILKTGKEVLDAYKSQDANLETFISLEEMIDEAIQDALDAGLDGCYKSDRAN